jgi:hypothetical protein
VARERKREREREKKKKRERERRGVRQRRSTAKPARQANQKQDTRATGEERVSE